MYKIELKTKKAEDSKDDSGKLRLNDKNDKYCLLKHLEDSTMPKIVKNVLTKHKNLFDTKGDVKINEQSWKISSIKTETISTSTISEKVPDCLKETRGKRKAVFEDYSIKKNINNAKKVEKCKLAVLSSSQISSTNFESISGETLVEAMNKYGIDFNNKFILIDCRLPYQYKAGHIRGAVNFYDNYEVTNFFFSQDNKHFTSLSKKVPIFYYTESKEPPIIFKLREIDIKRKIYSDIYLLDGGYEKFYNEKKYHMFCDPCGYVKPSLHAYLKDKNEINKRRREMNK